MGAGLDIANCTFSLSFLQPVPEIRRAAFDIEEKLKEGGYATPVQIYSVPDDAPYELPRLSAATPNQHSLLSISAQNAQVQSRFDENYSSDIELSLGYSKEKASYLLDVLSTLTGVQVSYAGVSAQVLVPAGEISQPPVPFISQTYLKACSSLPLSDASMKLVYDVDGDCYLNLEVQKIVLGDPISVSIGPDGVSVTKKLSGQEERLSVSVDFNNRRAFNMGRPLGCDSRTIENLYSRVDIFLTSGLDAFLGKGEVEF